MDSRGVLARFDAERQALARLYDAWGRPEEARAWRDRPASGEAD